VSGAALVIPAPGVRIMDLDDDDPAAGPLVAVWREIAERGVRALDPTEQRALVDTAITLLDQLYAHLPLKQSMYAVDPLQRLRLLRQRVGPLAAEEVHRELSAVFAGLNDAHTRYIGPASLRGCVAALGFFVEEHGPRGDRHYVVTKVADRAWIRPGSAFRPGVEVRYWNGTPMARAVERLTGAGLRGPNAETGAGAHPDARRARGLESLTFRSLQFEPVPVDHWVDLQYRTAAGEDHEIRLHWRVFTPTVDDGGPADPNPAALALGIDHPGRVVQRAKAELYAAAGNRQRARLGTPVETRLPGLISATRLAGPDGPLGYLRLWHFNVGDHGSYLDEIVRLLGRLPDRGLIVDVRANPGGLIWAAERVLQLLTPNRIEPARFSLPATELTRVLAADDTGGAELGPWQPSLIEAVATGERYSRSLPLTDPGLCNDIGQVYGGPVVCIADARTYSAGDLFAAGFVDNRIGPLVTVGEATGGGGANVWTHPQLQTRLTAGGTVAVPLPEGCGFTLAFRRATRAASSEGRPIEDVGIAGHLEHAMTRADVLNGNRDLLARAAATVANARFSRLDVRRPVSAGRPVAPVVVTTAGLDRLRLTVDELDTTTVAVTDGGVELDLPERWHTVEIEGIGAGQVLQRRRIRSL
jgi:hypothetical protein